MQKEAQVFQAPRFKLDEQGFAPSFDLDNHDPQQVRNFFDTFGFVVFNDILTNQEIGKTVEELWADIQIRCGKQNDLNDPTTWNFDGWRGKFGFVSGWPLNYLQMCLNRQNPKVYKAFKLMYELTSGKPLNEPLICQFDRGSGMRPTDGHPEWLTSDIYHFDINPWWWTRVIQTTRKDWRKNTDYNPDKFAKWLGQGCKTPYNGYTKLAGVMALTETNEMSGGFEAVCGFHKYIWEWCLNTVYNSPITDDPVLMDNFQKIFQRKGSLMIFTRQLPHNIYKNRSKSFRFAQYLRMSPESSLFLTEFEKEKRKECVLKFLPKELPVDDEISREIYMLK